MAIQQTVVLDGLGIVVLCGIDGVVRSLDNLEGDRIIDIAMLDAKCC